MAGDEAAATEQSSSALEVAIEGLVYTGEPQELITPQPGSWLYSLDGETYTEAIPTGVNAGTYTVYMKEGETVETVTVSIAKADVVFTPPVANTSTTNTTEDEQENEDAAPVDAAANEEAAYADGEEPAYSDGDVVDEVIFEE